MECGKIDVWKDRTMGPNETRPLKVLVVEDDRSALRLVAKFVSSAGHDVTLAENGREALDFIQQDSPDLVVCDWDMPEMDGVELCRRVRGLQLAHYVYFLLLTGKSSADEMVEGLEAGADDFVIKPINRAVFLARLEAGFRMLRMERQLRLVSELDPLTGVLNRRAFHDRFGLEWERVTRHDRSLSCAMIDLDFFKRVNDEHGHAVGDVALKTVSQILQETRRPNDIVSRYGGEEFCVLLPETDSGGAAEWAERVRSTISETPIHAGDLSLRLTASLGVAERRADTAGPEQLVDLADQALAVAKQSGRNRVVDFRSLDEPMLEPGDKQAFAGPFQGVSARDVMSVALVCPSLNDTVRYVTDVFLQLRTDSAPVVDEAGMVAGIVTEADLLARTAQGEGWDDKLCDVMRDDVICYEQSDSVQKVYEFFARVPISRVVVVDAGRPIGVISRATLLRWFRNWMMTRDEAGSCDPPVCPDGERERRKAGIVKITEAAVRRAVDLRQRIAAEDTDLVSTVVGEATKLQSLVNDLLGYCRNASVP